MRARNWERTTQGEISIRPGGPAARPGSEAPAARPRQKGTGSTAPGASPRRPGSGPAARRLGPGARPRGTAPGRRDPAARPRERVPPAARPRPGGPAARPGSDAPGARPRQKGPDGPAPQFVHESLAAYRALGTVLTWKRSLHPCAESRIVIMLGTRFRAVYRTLGAVMSGRCSFAFALKAASYTIMLGTRPSPHIVH